MSDKKTTLWAVKSKNKWVLPAKQRATLATTSNSMLEDKSASQLSKWCDIESYASNCEVTGHLKDDRRAIKTVEQTIRFIGERYEIGLLWREDELMVQNNFYLATGHIKSLERRLQRDDTLRQHYQETNDTDVKADYVRKVKQVELNDIRDKIQWYLLHHPVIKPHKTKEVGTVCNAAAKHQVLALNDKLPSEPEILQDLIGKIFRFSEHQIKHSVNKEAMFLQVLVPSDDNR